MVMSSDHLRHTRWRKIYDGKYDTKDVVSLNLNYKNETSYKKNQQ